MNLNTFTLIVFSLLALGSSGCATARKPAYDSRAASATAKLVRNADLEVSLDPFVQRERTRQYFGINAVDDGIGIVHVRIRNQTSDQTYLVEKKNFQLHLANSSTGETAAGKKIDRATAGGEATALVGASVISFPLIFAGAAMISQSTEIRRNFVAKEMADQTLAPGQNMDGFIYYTSVPKRLDWSRSAQMKVKFIETRSHKVTELEVPLTP